MKVRISVSRDSYEAVRAYLTEHGIEVSEEADYQITEVSRYATFLAVRDAKKDSMRLAVGEVIYIEAFGKEIEIHTAKGMYYAQDRMYQLEEQLDPKDFLRVSKSVIIARGHVKKIRPSLSMKYILTMTDGTLIDVTRSYYSDFRKAFRI
ncbi:MAG: LytTR family transcriptional regulator [Lachnospiraceae bacterium]|nr:LytTR family transcriptional regulator [Lachnospiraceae bacterium]